MSRCSHIGWPSIPPEPLLRVAGAFPHRSPHCHLSWPSPPPRKGRDMKMTNRWLASILCGGVSSIVLSAQNPTPHRDCAGLTQPQASRRQDHRGRRRARGNHRRDSRGALPRHRRHRHGDPVLAAAARHLEPQVHDGRRRRVRRHASTTRRSATVNAGYATVGTDTGHQGERHRRRAGRSTTSSAR